MNTALPTGVDVVVAAQTLGQTVRRTPLDLSLRLSGIRRQSVLLKREDIQVGRSYKVRGAYNFISGLPANEREAGIVCASAGNHAQGVAFACRQLKIHGKVFLPSTTPRQKRARIADIGGRWIEQIVGGAAFDEASSAAMEYADAHGATYVHPFDDPRTIAGQGTVVKELFEQASEKPATVVVPVGGGGLLAGTAIWLREFHPEVRIVGVEPSCTAVLRSDLEDLLPDDARAPLVKAMTYTLAELLTAPEPVGPGRGWRMPDLAGVEIVAQPHCHHYSVMGWAADEDLLRKAGASVTKVTGCCGLAGNFGMEKGHYEVSVKVAQARLVPALSEAGRDAVFLADGFSCRTQAGQLAGSRGIHLAELIRDGAEAARRRGGS